MLLTQYNNVYIIVVTMNNYTATVIKTGNSIALRVPKAYATSAKLSVGEKVLLPLPAKLRKQNRSKIEQIIGKLQSVNAYSTIDDPIRWQREQRADRQLPVRK